MQREIKFRVWDIKNKRFLSQSSEYYHIGDITGIPYTLNEILNKLDRFVVQQFTGLYDKNKKPIYEGDRVTYKLDKNYFFDEVKWEHNGWKIVNEKDKSSFPLITELEDFEVVGNIFQLPCNPDHNGECLVCDAWLSDCEFLNKEKNKI